MKRRRGVGHHDGQCMTCQMQTAAENICSICTDVGALIADRSAQALVRPHILVGLTCLTG